MSYKLEGRVEEWVFNVGTSDLVTIKLIPDAEYTLKQGDKKIVVILNETLADARCLEYDKHIILESVKGKTIDIATQLIGAKCISLTLSQCSTGITITSDKTTATGSEKPKQLLCFNLDMIGIKP